MSITLNRYVNAGKFPDTLTKLTAGVNVLCWQNVRGETSVGIIVRGGAIRKNMSRGKCPTPEMAYM